jgi:hypothetical protein
VHGQGQGQGRTSDYADVGRLVLARREWLLTPLIIFTSLTHSLTHSAVRGSKRVLLSSGGLSVLNDIAEPAPIRTIGLDQRQLDLRT